MSKLASNLNSPIDFFFRRKIRPWSPSGSSQKNNLVETTFLLSEHMLFCVLLLFYNISICFRLMEQVFQEIQFLAWPWGGPGANFSTKKKVDRTIKILYKLTQFFMLIQNIVLVFIKILLLLVKINQIPVKITPNHHWGIVSSGIF